jgi:hypothetical protein
MHWLDGDRDSRADYARLIGVEVNASGVDPPAPHDRFGRRHRNPPLVLRGTMTGPAIQ